MIQVLANIMQAGSTSVAGDMHMLSAAASLGTQSPPIARRYLPFHDSFSTTQYLSEVQEMAWLAPEAVVGRTLPSWVSGISIKIPCFPLHRSSSHRAPSLALRRTAGLLHRKSSSMNVEGT